MTRRALLALVSSLFVAASLLVAGPASATTRVSHDVPYIGVAAGSVPVMAVSSNGRRVVTVSTPRAAHGCPDGSSAFLLKGGFADEDGTNWEDHNEWMEAFPGEACAVATDVQVQLSDDGTTGLIVWTALNPGDQTHEVRFARINWTEGSFPTATLNSLHFAAGPWGYPQRPPMTSVALSLDGSRAVIAWALNLDDAQVQNVSTSTVRYSVIDMELPEASTQQDMPGGTYPGRTLAPDVAISADGSIVMMSRPSTVNSTPTTEFRIARVFTCSHNCYPKRLKRFEATVPAGSGGYNLEARMNLAGDRVAIAWANAGSARKPVVGVFNPNALVHSTAPINITSRMKPVASTSANELDLVFAMNETGTKIAYLGRGSDKVQVVTAAITTSLALSSVVTTNMYPSPVQGITRLTFVNATAAYPGALAAPERLAVVTPDATNYPSHGVSTVFKVLVSDSASNPTNWAEVYSSTVPGSSWFTSTNFAHARTSNRFVVSTDKVLTSGQAFSYESTALVGNLKNVLSVTTKPVLSGSGVYNTLLTLNLGKWSAGTALSYSWKRGETVLDPQPAGLTYKPLTAQDMGLRMSATVTATKTGYYTSAITPAQSPVMTGKPVIVVFSWGGGTGPNGAPRVGDNIWARFDDSTPAIDRTVVSRTWKVGNSVVGSSGTYLVTPANLGKKITLTVKISAPNWATTTASSTTPVVVAAGP